MATKDLYVSKEEKKEIYHAIKKIYDLCDKYRGRKCRYHCAGCPLWWTPERGKAGWCALRMSPSGSWFMEEVADVLGVDEE